MRLKVEKLLSKLFGRQQLGGETMGVTVHFVSPTLVGCVVRISTAGGDRTVVDFKPPVPLGDALHLSEAYTGRGRFTYSLEDESEREAEVTCSASPCGPVMKDLLVDLILAALWLPRCTRGPGGASTGHRYTLPASSVWGLDVVLDKVFKAFELGRLPSSCRVGHSSFNERAHLEMITRLESRLRKL